MPVGLAAQSEQDKDEVLEYKESDFKQVESFLEDYFTSPSRDIPADYKAFKSFRYREETAKYAMRQSEELTICRGNCEDLFMYCDALDVPILFPDAFSNDVSFFGFYGDDPRQRYYVYLPTVAANSKVAVLVHGGAWFAGPNPDEVIGFPFQYATPGSNESLVKDLLASGYTVVSILYRTAKLGATSTEIQSNFSAGKSALDRMLDDIENAINHFRSTMLSCYSIEFNAFHVIGESSGGHASLMYAYTRANPTIVKSVTSMYAPANMSQFYNWISNPQPTNMYTCDSVYTIFTGVSAIRCPQLFLPVWLLSAKHNPFFWRFNVNNTLDYYNHFPASCTTIDSSEKVFTGQNLIRSLMGKFTPSTAELNTISPAYQSNMGVIPTFAMYGNNDFVVNFDQSAQDFSSNLATNGGVLQQNAVCYVTAMPTLNPSQKHLIRRYQGTGHGMLAVTFPLNNFTTLMFNRVRADILSWLNSH